MRFNALLFVLCGCFLLACQTDSVQRGPEVALDGQQVSSRGQASMKGLSVEQARQAAIDQAIGNASAQLRRNNASSTLIGDIKVVDEWQDGDVYHVQALAALSAKSVCAAPYRKKLVSTAFPIMNTDQVSGIESQDLFGGIPREIGNRLMESGDFIVRNLTNTMLYARPEIAPEIVVSGVQAGSPVFNAARQFDAQFVLSGVIRDFKVESTEYVRGSGVMAQLKWALRDVVARRSVGIDVFVHDGYTGALLFQHRYTESILGDVSLPAGYVVGSDRFESSPAGHKISEIIHQAADDIRQQIGCYPFAARVARVDGQRVIIAAGAQDKIKVGDRMMVYSGGFSHTAGMGFTEPLGILSLTDVGPTMASGQFEGTAIVRPGDWVRSFAAQ